MPEIRIAIAGIGNCASALVQGLAYYAPADGAAPMAGLMHPSIAGYTLADMRIVAAFDIDRRKVGQPLEAAIFARPNNTRIFCPRIPASGITVQMAPILDGIAPHMEEYGEQERFEPSNESPVDIGSALQASGAQILVNYLPVGAQQATEQLAEACIKTGVSLVNCIPVFIASDNGWAERFRSAGIPIVGDDVKAQVGATITHRTLARLLADRGMSIENTYQLNVGGNTDFLNMLARDRLVSKKISKTSAVQSQLDAPLPAERIHIGPADYVPFLKDNKVCFLRLAASGFGGVGMEIELRLSVEDSPNSAGVVVDAIRCCQIARDRGLSGPIDSVCAYTMKHPPMQMPDTDARRRMEAFIAE